MLQDAWANNKGIIEVDSYQDCNDFAWKRSILSNMTKFSFTRKLDTCDERDYIIEVITHCNFLL